MGCAMHLELHRKFHNMVMAQVLGIEHLPCRTTAMHALLPICHVQQESAGHGILVCFVEYEMDVGV